jgi:hypothetical protein
VKFEWSGKLSECLLCSTYSFNTLASLFCGAAAMPAFSLSPALEAARFSIWRIREDEKTIMRQNTLSRFNDNPRFVVDTCFLVNPQFNVSPQYIVKSQFIVSVVLRRFLCEAKDLCARSWLPTPALGSQRLALDPDARPWIEN